MFFKLSSEYLHSFNLINTSLEASSRFASSFIYVTYSPYEKILQWNYFSEITKKACTTFLKYEPQNTTPILNL